jgi:hypothetical protein
VIWAPRARSRFPTGAGYGDDGIGSESHIVDIDGDGWREIVVSSVDHGSERLHRSRAHLPQLGGTPGGNVDLREEAQQSGRADGRA